MNSDSLSYSPTKRAAQSSVDTLNKQIYETPFAVECYGKNVHLQKPEQTIPDKLRDRLSAMKMLDIGVGAGRTAHHFIPLVREYVGVDYSAKMIDACNRAFPNPPTHISFRVCDATDMRMFEDHSFDFVLFSYNGIDYLSHPQRICAFKEINRVIKPGGMFSFSSHNLYGMRQLFEVQLDRNPLKLWKSIRRCILTRRANENRHVLFAKDEALIYENAHVLKFANYCIKPEAQLTYLRELGFADIHVYDLNGSELHENDFQSCHDLWVYYLCRASEQ